MVAAIAWYFVALFLLDVCRGYNIPSGQKNRRNFLYDVTWKTAVPSALLFFRPQVAQAAAAPITVGETQNIGAQTLRKFRPKPPRILRQKLNLNFAVLLMRSSYAVTGTFQSKCEYIFIVRVYITDFPGAWYCR